jgi:XRE family transcriptional regulator, aerobic/anaerobic benzoate catabolism transcriptional regulator
MDAERLLAELGRRTRELRTDHGWTLRELSEGCGLSTRFLAQVESGTGNISVRNLAAMATALGSTPAALLSGKGEEADRPVVALLGLRGAGKTTIGRKLARRLRVPFVELDQRVERAAGLPLGELFRLHDEAYYRRLERETLEKLLGNGRSLVVATGGGLVTSDETWTLLRRRALTVWLKARPEDHWNRVVQQGDRRPMAEHPQAMAELRRLLATREPLYAQSAHTIDTSRLGVVGTVRAIERLACRQAPALTR